MVSILGEEGATSFSTPMQGSCSDLDMTAPKLACFQVMVVFASSPFIIMLMAQSIILDPNMTTTFSE